MSKFLIIYFLLTTLLIQAQQSQYSEDALGKYQDALHLYNQNQFAAAVKAFKQISGSLDSDQLESNIEFYLANCAIKLGEPTADEQMEDFIRTNPTSLKTNKANLEVGNY